MPVNIKPTSVIKTRLGIQKGGRVHSFLTDTCAKAMDKYVPFDTGTLAETVVLKNGDINRTNVTVDTITYSQEYAKIVYYGIRNGKQIVFHTDKHSLATAYWDKVMWTAKGQDIIKQVQDYINRGGK
jgi:hypothetical protein